MASYRKPALANAAWRRLKRLHGSILGQLSGHTERADLGKRGVYYRVQAGIFGNAAGARAACTKLQPPEAGLYYCTVPLKWGLTKLGQTKLSLIKLRLPGLELAELRAL